MIDKNVLEYIEKLNEIGVENSILEHPFAIEPGKVLNYLNLDFSDSLPTLIMKADGNFIAVVLRGDYRADFKKIKKELRVKDLRMAAKEEFVSLTGLPIGAARVYNPNIRTIIDARVFEKEYLAGGSGSFTCTIKYKTEDLKKIPNNVIMDVSKVKDDENEIASGRLRRPLAMTRGERS